MPEKESSEEQSNDVRDPLEAYVREGVRQMLVAVLKREASVS